MQKAIEFYLLHHEIPQRLSRLCGSLAKKLFLLPISKLDQPISHSVWDQIIFEVTEESQILILNDVRGAHITAISK